VTDAPSRAESLRARIREVLAVIARESNAPAVALISDAGMILERTPGLTPEIEMAIEPLPRRGTWEGDRVTSEVLPNPGSAAGWSGYQLIPVFAKIALVGFVGEGTMDAALSNRLRTGAVAIREILRRRRGKGRPEERGGGRDEAVELLSIWNLDTRDK